MTQHHDRPHFWRRHRNKAIALALVPSIPLIAHIAIDRVASRVPPAVHRPSSSLRTGPREVRRFGKSYTRRVGRLTEVRLAGSPEQVGFAHATLLYDSMVETERAVWELLDHLVPNRLLRLALMDFARLRYRNVADSMSEARLSEIAAGARAFSPDPFADRVDTFERFVHLNALYDISLGFEHSPLIGCTTFVVPGPTGSPLLARNFDFEAHDVFDQRKAVFFVLEDGRIPFASVAWPGLVGVVSGMNLEGVGAVVHGARAGDPRTQGEPVVHALRRVLSRASTTREAVRRLVTRPPMVSHIVIVADVTEAAVVERVPGRDDHVRWLDLPGVVTNHLAGPSAGDPKNQRVRATTSTLARARRGRELLEQHPEPFSPVDAVKLLRDRRARGGARLPLGDRRAIDALIATHGVVMDFERRTLWVSEAPHLLGRFVAFDLHERLDPDFSPDARPQTSLTIPADPMLKSGDYARTTAASAQ